MSSRILAVASGGGHWVQLRRLRGAFEGLDVAFVSVKSAYADDVKEHRFYNVRDATRWNKFGLLILAVQLAGILLKERPKIVITTGAAPGLIAIALARHMLGARTVWIDSIANCETMSSSGLHARRFADVWLTQWPQLAGPAGPVHWGAVL
jgi:UDP-N-acetylglucosamine:LPS N-acetylglucosamine transferase